MRFNVPMFLFVPVALAASFVACSDDAEQVPAVASASDAGPAGLDSAAPGPSPNGGSDAGTVDAATGTDAGTTDAAGPVPGAHIVAYAFNVAEDLPEWTPDASVSYNAAGGTIKVTRASVGNYAVKFAGLALGDGVALVSAYGTVGGLCHWDSTTKDTVSVRCLNAAGNVADARFSVTVFDKNATKGATILGFAHANDMNSASYTPQASRSNNAVGGGAITASRTGTGTYKMDFGGLAQNDIENAQVVSYGSETARCVVHSVSGTSVNVRCYDLAGTLADAQYALMIAGEKAGGTAKVVAYAHAADSANASYTPALSHNDGNGAVTATRSEAGKYSVTFDGRNLNTGAHVQVVAQGQGRRCNVGAWAGTSAQLTCTDSTGTKRDNNYGVIVLQ